MLSAAKVNRVEEMLAAGATHEEIARAVGCPLTSVAWIEAGDHPQQRNQRQEAQQRRQDALRARAASRAPAPRGEVVPC